MTNVINFYSTKGPYGCFSNFSRHEVYYNNMLWKTSEHAFQQAKYLDEKNKNDIFFAITPRIAADIGRDKNRPLRIDWELIKDSVMRKIVYAKFKQHYFIKDILLSTDKCILVEHTENDSYWGDGGDGSGNNMLGKILMMVREELRNEI